MIEYQAGLDAGHSVLDIDLQDVAYMLGIVNHQSRAYGLAALARAPAAWHDRHAAQQQLYEAVTDYVRHGYNQAMAAKQRHIGFLMILMQRLVTSRAR